MDITSADSAAHPALCRFAAKAIRKRLRALAKEQAGAREAHDPECVHRMRVATRRLNVALNQFAPCFPERQFKRWHAALRRLRQALGDARDFDVQILFLEALLPTKALAAEAGDPGEDAAGVQREHVPGVVRVLLRKRQRRERLQKDVIRALDRFEDDDILHGVRAGLLAIHDSDEADESPAYSTRDLIAVAGLAIQERLDELLHWERFVDDPEQIDQHHEMRIAAKHLRYTLELFAPLYTGELEPEIAVCKECQELLGNIHDADVWIQLLPKFIDRERQRTVDYHGHLKPMDALLPGLRWLEQRCRTARTEQFVAFQQLWRRCRDERIWERLSDHVIRTESTSDPAAPTA